MKNKSLPVETGGLFLMKNDNRYTDNSDQKVTAITKYFPIPNSQDLPKIKSLNMFDELVIFDTPVLHRDGNHWSHLVARDIDLLHEFAKKIGLKKEWFQDKPGMPHYDIKTDRVRSLAKANGAIQVQRKYLYIYLQVRYKLQTLHGSHYELTGILAPYVYGVNYEKAICDKCRSPLFINRQWDNWCSNAACEYNMADFKPFFDKVHDLLLPKERSFKNEAENKPGTH